MEDYKPTVFCGRSGAATHKNSAFVKACHVVHKPKAKSQLGDGTWTGNPTIAKEPLLIVSQ